MYMIHYILPFLSGFTSDDWKWAKEILQWIIAAAKSLSICKLKTAVESPLQDELGDFEKFIQEGARLLFRSLGAATHRLRFIHQTFHSLSVRPHRVPEEFHLSAQLSKSRCDIDDA